MRTGHELDQGFAHDVVEAAIDEADGVAVNNRLIVLSRLLAGDAAHLEDIHKIRLEGELNGHVDGGEVEIFNREVVEEYIAREQLLAPDMKRIFRQVEAIAQRD